MIFDFRSTCMSSVAGVAFSSKVQAFPEQGMQYTDVSDEHLISDLCGWISRTGKARQLHTLKRMKKPPHPC
jgi:hypothetical protein